jgi:outer membrane scaffolding protein for murein synthesis (MipA/OmpV family)
MLYRSGFQSEIDGVEAGEKLEMGNLGVTLNYEVNDNFSIKTGFSSNVFGDENLDSSMVRLQLVYGWHPSMENIKKLQHGH